MFTPNDPLLVAVVGFQDASTLIYALTHVLWTKTDTFFKRIIVISADSAELVAQNYNNYVAYFAPIAFLEAMSRDQMPWSGLEVLQFARHAITGESLPVTTPPQEDESA